ncbi:MAG: ABC transporter ATP-binding protein [Planctomycetes bacterium]|nr:ABC transporter ATP-binding protein [Planctomycetota bacterium]
MTAIVEFENLSKRFGKYQALRDVTLSLEPGAIGLLGPNGAGKSTLIKILLGLIKPSGGKGRVLEFDIRKKSRRIRELVGYMPEMDCHIPSLSAVSIVSLCAELTGMPRVEAMQRAHESLYYVGVGEERYRYVETYSAGMKQRVKLACAIVGSPDVVFLDEPTNGLDPKGRDEMLSLVRDLFEKRGISVILSSHLLPDVERVCKNVFVMHEGRIRLTGSIEELKKFHTPSFTVTVEGDLPNFVAKCAEHGFEVEKDDDEKNVLHVTIEDGEPAQRLFELAKSAGCWLRSFDRREVSLEDVFLSAIR